MTIKFPVSRRHIDAKGFLFKTTFTSKSDAKGVPWVSKSDAKTVLCEELGWDCVEVPPSDKHSLLWLASWLSALWLAEHHKHSSEM